MNEKTDRAYEEASNFIVSWYFRLLGLAVVSGVLLSSYLGFASTEAISYQLDDAGTTCHPNTEGIGTHCFSDFYLPLNLSNMDSPWSFSNVPYPPLGLAIFKPFAYLHSHFPGQLSVVTYLLLAFSVIVLSAYFFSRKLKLSGRTTGLILLIVSLSAPTITILDRGNNTFLILPLLFYMATNLAEEKRRNFIIAGVLIVLIKPQFILLGIFFLIVREWRNLFVWISSASVGMLASFILYPKNVLSNFLHWAYHLLLFQQYRPFGERYPINISLNSFAEISLRTFGIEVDRILVSGLVVSILVIAIVALRASSHSRSQYEIFILVLIIPVLFVGTSFHYYLSVLLIPLTVLIAQAFGEVPKVSFDISNLISSRIRMTLVLLTLSFSLSPWAFPSRLIIGAESGQGKNISLTWEIARVAFAVTFIFLVLAPSTARGKAIQ